MAQRRAVSIIDVSLSRVAMLGNLFFSPSVTSEWSTESFLSPLGFIFEDGGHVLVVQ
jgi:hypothetical protein